MTTGTGAACAGMAPEISGASANIMIAPSVGGDQWLSAIAAQ
jgi:hypothetical protein